MKQYIRGIYEDAWTTTESGWTEPKMTDAVGIKVLKPKTQWTDEEKKKSKYNSRALTAIHCSLALKKFNMVQGCETAKGIL